MDSGGEGKIARLLFSVDDHFFFSEKNIPRDGENIKQQKSMIVRILKYFCIRKDSIADMLEPEINKRIIRISCKRYYRKIR